MKSLLLILVVLLMGCDTYVYVDECGNVNGDNSCVDCAGVANGSAYKDQCDECVGGTVGVTGCDCAGITNGSASPVGTNMSHISGHGYTMAINSDDQIVAWGNDQFGQQEIPENLATVKAVSAGWSYSLALTTDGQVRAWGTSRCGSMAISCGGGTSVPDDLNNIVDIEAGQRGAYALTTDGQVRAWGSCGDGERYWMNGSQKIHSSFCVDATVPSDLNNVVAIDSGNRHVIALTSDGQVVAWHDTHECENNCPTTGNIDPTCMECNYNVGRVNAAINVPSDLNNVIAISAYGDYSLALTSDGKVYAWGYEYYGATEVPENLENVVAIDASCAGPIALLADGRVVAWGHHYSDPHGLNNVPDDLNNAVAISGNCNAQYLALTADGQIVIWGNTATPVPSGYTWKVDTVCE